MKINDDTISNGIMKMHEFDNEVLYRIACDCGADEHDATISIEYDKEINYLSLRFWKKVCWCPNWENKWYNKIWKRITGTLKMLFTGYVELEEDFLIREDDNIKDFITALIEGRQKLQSYEDNIKSK